MNHEQPLWHRIYFNQVYTDVCLAVGYRGMTWRDLAQVIEDLARKHDKREVESAVYHTVTFEGQMTCNPKPLAEVRLRGEARGACFMLLGAPPEHPWHGLLKEGPHLPRSWDQPREPPAEARRPEEPKTESNAGRPKRRTRKK